MLFAVAFLCAVSAANAVPPNWSGSDVCGKSKYPDAGEMFLPGKFIVGGQEARIYEFPWQASIRSTSGSHYCGGSVISRRWILTAAHCMDGETPAAVLVVVGDWKRNDPDALNPARQTLNVASIHTHTGYDSRTMQNDISLIKLTADIVFSEDLGPVCAPDPVELYTYWKTQCSGWGTLSSGGACCPQTLMYVTMNITTNAFCDQVYTRDTIYDDMICASDNVGGTDRDSCQGDSGGPLTVKEADGTFRIVGIVSWGIGCASGYPGVYCRSGYHADWVTNIINSN